MTGSDVVVLWAAVTCWLFVAACVSRPGGYWRGVWVSATAGMAVFTVVAAVLTFVERVAR